MRKSLGSALLVAAGLAAGSAAPSIGAPPGNTIGQSELPRFTELSAIRTLEQEAISLCIAQPPDAELPSEVAAAVTARIDAALAGLAALKTAISGGSGYQKSTVEEAAVKNLDKAAKADGKAKTKIEKHRSASTVARDLASAEDAKTLAQLCLLGTPATPKELPLVRANPVSPGAYVQDAETKSSRDLMKRSRQEAAEGLAEAMEAAQRSRREAQERYEGLSVAAFKPLPNYYYAFEGTSSNPGFTFKTMGRQLFGPFETRFQVGSFIPGDAKDTGSACIEFDLEGSSPLQFVAVCGRRINGGVQVFVQSQAGAAGSLFLPSTTIAQVLVDYSGTAFTVKAASGRGAPDFVLSPVATVNFTQGSTALIAGLGASGLTKGAEIGVDEIYITAK